MFKALPSLLQVDHRLCNMYANGKRSSKKLSAHVQAVPYAGDSLAEARSAIGKLFRHTGQSQVRFVRGREVERKR